MDNIDKKDQTPNPRLGRLPLGDYPAAAKMLQYSSHIKFLDSVTSTEYVYGRACGTMFEI